MVVGRIMSHQVLKCATKKHPALRLTTVKEMTIIFPKEKNIGGGIKE